jgi:hypothetical protein
VLAYKWLSLSALQGNADAESQRHELAASMSPGQVTQAQRLALKWILELGGSPF